MTDLVFHFSERNFLVTGGSRGIGRGIVKALANAGANVAFTYKSNTQAANDLVKELKTSPGKVMAIQADARQSDGAEALVERVENELGELDGLVNNAGVKHDMAAFRMDPQSWLDVIDTNLNGTFFLSQAVSKRFIRKNAGKIVNISSVSGLMGIAGQTNYCSSKAAVIGLTRSLAKEVARFNIQVNAIAPGFIETDMVKDFPDKKREQTRKSVPVKRFGRCDEVASASLYLLSDASDYVTGHTLTIDGGLTA